MHGQLERLQEHSYMHGQRQHCQKHGCIPAECTWMGCIPTERIPRECILWPVHVQGEQSLQCMPHELTTLPSRWRGEPRRAAATSCSGYGISSASPKRTRSLHWAPPPRCQVRPQTYTPCSTAAWEDGAASAERHRRGQPVLTELSGAGVGGGDPGVELVGGEPGQRGLKLQVFPGADPRRREDVRLLAHWLTETLSQLEGSLPQVWLCAYPHCESAQRALAGSAAWPQLMDCYRGASMKSARRGA
jgi:hypothetical protein